MSILSNTGIPNEAVAYDTYGEAVINGRFVGLPQVPALDPPP